MSCCPFFFITTVAAVVLDPTRPFSQTIRGSHEQMDETADAGVKTIRQFKRGSDELKEDAHLTEHALVSFAKRSKTSIERKQSKDAEGFTRTVPRSFITTKNDGVCRCTSEPCPAASFLVDTVASYRTYCLGFMNQTACNSPHNKVHSNDNGDECSMCSWLAGGVSGGGLLTCEPAECTCPQREAGGPPAGPGDATTR